jgi:hypothetical protein
MSIAEETKGNGKRIRRRIGKGRDTRRGGETGKKKKRRMRG